MITIPKRDAEGEAGVTVEEIWRLCACSVISRSDSGAWTMCVWISGD